ncbi:MAG TPA: hypothetical protein VHE08_08500 [Solirubrobacterales bacterium]|nr:hypothetical protein [Solirubrobacterales bacterium]
MAYPRPRRPLCSLLLALTLALPVVGLVAAPASAKVTPKFHRGGLPSIGEITLRKMARGKAQVTVPVTYTKALSGPPSGLESSVVTLHLAARTKRGRPVGTEFERKHQHRLDGSGTIVDRFVLDRATSGWLFARSAKLRGRLIRVDVSHLVKSRRGTPPLYEKDASQTMASSHRAHPQGASGILTLSNQTSEPINTVATPIVCMYTDGEEGSNLEWFTQEGLAPGGSIEAEIEADGSIFDEAEYQGPTGPSAGAYFSTIGFEIDAIATEFDVELTPFVALVELGTHCDATASIFSLVVGSTGRQASSSEAFVPTNETCRIGCPDHHFISAFEALGYQSPYEDGTVIWNSRSTELLESFAGAWAGRGDGRIVQDDGLHFTYGEAGDEEWNATVGAGSSSAGFSG